MRLYGAVFRDFEKAIDSFLDATVADAIASIMPVVSALCGVYFILYAWAGMRGHVHDWGNDLAMRFIRMVAILSIGMTAVGYGKYVQRPVLDLPLKLTAIVSKRSSDRNDIPRMLDEQMLKIQRLGDKSFVKGVLTWSLVTYYFGGVVFHASALVMTVYAAYLILLAKGMLAVLLAFGPVFIACLLFDATRRFFDTWLGLLVNFMVVHVFAFGVVSLTYNVFKRHLDDMGAFDGLEVATAALVIAVINFLLLASVPQMAAAFVGGGGVAGGVGGGVGQWLGGAATGGASRLLSARAKHREERRRKSALAVGDGRDGGMHGFTLKHAALRRLRAMRG